MEQRLANTWRMTVNEKKFIETALRSGHRIDGRDPFDYRHLSINFGKDEGSAEVQLGHTHVMAFVTAQLVQPYRDRPNEGSLSIFTEFSPMADPSFEPGRPGQSAVELGRVIDRGLRESRAVDTESLCVVSGKLVWAIRLDLHILDNGGNLIDAANIAALAALLTFRRPECSLGGENGQEVIIHPPQERDPVHLIIHHLPIAVTFAFFSFESSVVIDPTHHEEAVMGGRMTATLNSNGDICAIQKAGGEGVLQSVIMQCLRIAAAKAGALSDMIKKEVDSYNTERALRKIKRHSSAPMDVDRGQGQKQNSSIDQMKVDEFSKHRMERVKPVSKEAVANQSEGAESESKSSEKTQTKRGSDECDDTENFVGGTSSWSPYSMGVDSSFLKASLAPQGTPMPIDKVKDSNSQETISQSKPEEVPDASIPMTSHLKAAETSEQTNGQKTLEDAVNAKKRKPRRKKS